MLVNFTNVNVWQYILEFGNTSRERQGGCNVSNFCCLFAHVFMNVFGFSLFCLLSSVQKRFHFSNGWEGNWTCAVDNALVHNRESCTTATNDRFFHMLKVLDFWIHWSHLFQPFCCCFPYPMWPGLHKSTSHDAANQLLVLKIFGE